MTGKDDTYEPQVLEEPGKGAFDENANVWMRGLWMIVMALLFGVGEFILGVSAIVQFLWMLIGKEKNQPVAEFGEDLADWLARVARFQTGATEDKPFPFAPWGRRD